MLVVNATRYFGVKALKQKLSLEAVISKEYGSNPDIFMLLPPKRGTRNTDVETWNTDVGTWNTDVGTSEYGCRNPNTGVGTRTRCRNPNTDVETRTRMWKHEHGCGNTEHGCGNTNTDVKTRNTDVETRNTDVEHRTRIRNTEHECRNTEHGCGTRMWNTDVDTDVGHGCRTRM
ncbi:hypothetical protein ACSQ67_012965 [Phaseolus vulgaris]